MFPPSASSSSSPHKLPGNHEKPRNGSLHVIIRPILNCNNYELYLRACLCLSLHQLHQTLIASTGNFVISTYNQCLLVFVLLLPPCLRLILLLHPSLRHESNAVARRVTHRESFIITNLKSCTAQTEPPPPLHVTWFMVYTQRVET